MTFSEVCHSIVGKSAIRESVNKSEFVVEASTKDDPWGNLAAAIILQSLLDDLSTKKLSYIIVWDPKTRQHRRIAENAPINEEFYEVLADGIGIQCSYAELKNRMPMPKANEKTIESFMN